MARKRRIFLENLSQHVLLSSLNNMHIFPNKIDYEVFIKILEEINQKYYIQIHAYIIMPTYFEFVATPKDADTLPKFIQSLGRKYVSYFNEKYARTGTLWEGRYKSSLVEDDLYLFDVMKYIESQSDKDYEFSSVHKNLYAKLDGIITCHKLYKKLGYTDEQRVSKYTDFFNLDFDEEKYKFITTCINKQLITGSLAFIKRLENLIGITLISKTRGRPKKETTNKRKKMYKNLVVLDKEKHQDLKISSLEDLYFAKETSHIPVVAGEVAPVGATFPVVFTGDENPSLMAIVSLSGESLAINNEGKWITKYVPSTLRKYPFSLGNTKDNPDQKVILIDEESSLFSKSKGKQLFKKNGDKSESLSKAIEFLTLHEKEVKVTQNIAKLIADAGILEDREISVGEGDEKKVLVNGFKVVDRDKLNKLSDDILADWVRKGIISMIDAHIKSLENIQTLFNLAHQRQS